MGASGLGEAHHAVDAVVVGEGQGLEPQTHGLLHQLFGVRRAVEEAEVGVAVQLGVGDTAGAPRATVGDGGSYGWRLYDQAGLSPPSPSGG